MHVKSRNDIQNNLTIYRGFTPSEINERIRKNRKNFEQRCQRQGVYLPSRDEMDRWFKEKKV